MSVFAGNTAIDQLLDPYQKYKKNVIPFGRTPSANIEGQEINVPQYDGTTNVIDMSDAIASIAHEYFHLHYDRHGMLPDWSSYKRTCFNVLDDIRIEHVGGNKYPVFKAPMYKSNLRCSEKQNARVPSMSPFDQIMFYTLAEQFGTPMSEKMLSDVAKEGVEKIRDKASEWKNVSNIDSKQGQAGIVKLADEVLELLQLPKTKEEEEEMKQQFQDQMNQMGDTQEDQQSSDGDGEGKSKSKPSDKDDERKDGSGSSSSGEEKQDKEKDDKDGEGESSESSVKDGEGKSKSKSSDKDGEEKSEKEGDDKDGEEKSDKDKKGKKKVYVNYGETDFENIQEEVKEEMQAEIRIKYEDVYGEHTMDSRDDRVYDPPENRYKYENSLKSIQNDVHVLTQFFMNRVAATSKDKTLVTRTGRVYKKQIPKFCAIPGTRIHSRKIKRESFDIAITILVDLSLSMSSIIDEAMIATIALAEAISKTKIRFEIIGFHTKYRETNSPVTRQCGQAYHVYKSYDDRFEVVKHKLASMRPDNANADGDALLFGFHRQKRQKAKRDIMFIINDGNPNYENRGCSPNVYLKKVVELIRKTTTLIGFGLETTKPKEFYGSQFVHIPHVRGMGEELVKQLTEVIFNQKGIEK